MEYGHSEEFLKSIGESPENQIINEGEVETSVYESEIGAIEIKSKVFMPEDTESNHENKGKGIIFLPGYGVEAGYNSVKEINEAYVKYGHKPVYSISTRTEEVKDMPSVTEMSSLHYEAEAITNFIKDKGLTEVAVAGYSQGGGKTMEMLAIMQEEHPEIKLSKLTLFDSTGLAHQTASQLKRNFFKDATLTPPGIKPIRAGLDILFSAFKESFRSNTDFFKRINRDAAAMAELSTSAEKLRMPIVLVQGENDMVSDVNEIIPNQEAMLRDREGYLKEHLFKSSPYVRMIIGKKQSHHGMPTYRSDQVVKTSEYMHDRYARTLRKKAE